jgi:UDP-N-acetylmuramyl pentapeptide phosphotransferase/UDP-N-acetylglucosamine-1-phosphate transferase
LSDALTHYVLLLLAPAAASALAALVATRAARRWGWVDGGSGAHKLGQPAWPLSGGPALFAGSAVLWLCVEAIGRAHAPFVPGRGLAALVGGYVDFDVTLWPFGAVATAFVVGCIDDGLEHGLSPLLKLFGQAACGFVLATPLLLATPLEIESYLAATALIVAAVVVLNCVNTFDNADGAALALAGLGLAPTAAPFAAALAGFAPVNLWSDRGAGWRRKAILGDSGSHLVGALVLITPAAWPVLIVPALDLARLCFVRLRLGAAPWDGDRRHLAHRLARLGLAPRRVALVLAAIALPGAVGAAWGSAWAVSLGAAVTVALFAGVLRLAPAAPEVVEAPPTPAVARPTD